ncbi:tRNA (adenosine(37)-N6)-dimethylallyltransferase MiaA [Patescibacteria group bacterium]|nr:tRNA (adenosine(37)-N6)-dimethylallyltransferase MiaA [Patescibacteria group bacterium]
MAKKIRIIAVVGPTASGKSSLGVYLAQKCGGEIISADSRQVYRGLNIGSGKVTKKEMAGVPHHLLDVASPKKQFSADDFVKHSERAIKDITESDLIYQVTFRAQLPPVPIVVGGTGFYTDALLGRITLPQVPPNQKLREQLEQKTVEQLFKQLKKLDPNRAKTIEPYHKRRLIRAIEIAKYPNKLLTTGKNHRGDASMKYDVLWLGLKPNTEKLKKNIHTRLLARLKQGMVAEAKRLHARGLSYKRMEELGLEYRSLAKFLQKKISKKELEEEIERGNWLYAKRQMRWFKRNPDIHWVKSPPDSRAGKTEALRLARKFLKD